MTRLPWLLTISFLLHGCGWQSTFAERQPVPLSQSDFDRAKGYRLDYSLYMPNSYTGWTPDASNQFIYNPERQSYQLTNLNIDRPPVDSWGARFKITNADWTYEYAFTKAHDTPEQSKFGIRPQGTVVQLRQIVYASDMYFELPHNADAHYLQAEFKITRPGDDPQGLLFIQYSEQPVASAR